MSLYARSMAMTKVEIDDIWRLLNCDVKSGLNKRRMVLGVAEDLCRRKRALPLRQRYEIQGLPRPVQLIQISPQLKRSVLSV